MSTRKFKRGCTELALIDLKAEQVKSSATKIRNNDRTSYVQLVSFSKAQTKSAGKTGLEGSPREIEVEGYECNVAEETSVKEVFEDIVQNFGRIDSVIASAG